MRCFFVLATVAVGGVLLAPGRADAHAMHAKVEVHADMVKLEVYFEEDLPAEFAEVIVADATGATVLTGKTDERGVWTFPPPKPGQYVLTAKSTGHTKTVNFLIAGEPAAAEAPPVVFTGPQRDKLFGLSVGVGALLGLSAVYWFVRRPRRVK